MEERPIGDALDAQRDQGARRHSRCQDERQQQQRRRLQRAFRVERVGGEHAGIGADHHHVGMGEVDHAQDAVDHRVAQRDQRIDAADGEAEQREGQPVRRGVAVGQQAGHAADDEHGRHGHADDQEGVVDPGAPAHPVGECAGGCRPSRHQGKIFFGLVPAAKLPEAPLVNSQTA